jgi:peptide deformylase
LRRFYTDLVAEEHGQIRDEELDAERSARKQLALAQIRQYPDPVLRMEARPVESFDDDLHRLAERMALLMVDANGVGLAATQVGVLRRIFVFRGRDDDDDEATVLVNPELVRQGEEVEADDEGCLSLQGVLVPVERSLAIAIEAADLGGEKVQLELDGYAARVAQHELDHLNGVLILDRTTEQARREALATLRQQPVLGARD